MLSCVMRSLGMDYKVRERASSFPHGGVVTRGRQPSAVILGWKGISRVMATGDVAAHLWLAVCGSVCLLPGSVGWGGVPAYPGAQEQTVFTVWVFMADKPGIKGILRSPFEDDIARSQRVCEGREVWHWVRETVNLLERLNFMFK